MTQAEIKYLKPRLNIKHTVITDLINIEHIKILLIVQFQQLLIVL